MSTLYEILEVSENASKEVIEKAYRVLAKKYHPDLQSDENKKVSETKMKQINEAYSVLSDEIRRKEYDEELTKKRELEKREREQLKSNIYGEDGKTYEQNYNDKIKINQNDQRYYDMQRRKYEEELRKEQERIRRKMEENMRNQYENAYYNYLRSLGYRIKEEWTWEKTKKLLIVFLVISVAFGILWTIPPTHNIMISFYENNTIIKIIVDIIVGAFMAIFKAIDSFFKSLFG